MGLLTPIKTKKEVKLSKSLQVLVGVAMLVAIATFVATQKFEGLLPPSPWATGVTVAISAWLVIFLGLFYGWPLKLIAQVLGGKGEFVHGLATVAYSALPVAIGALLAVLLAYIPLAGALLSFVSVAVFGVIGYALVFRLTKLLFEVDMITAFVAVSILTAITTFAVYAASISFGRALILSKLPPTLH